MKRIKKIEEIVLEVLERNHKPRKDDFILYGHILHKLGVDLKNTSLYDFLGNAKKYGYPTFETVSRCRRHIQEIRQDLIDTETAIKREDAEEVYKEYNRTSIGV